MGKNRKLKPRNYIGGAKIVIKHHVVERYAERTGASMKTAREKLVLKFLNSKLSKLYPDGTELRAEVLASMNKRMMFVSVYKPKTNTYIVLTCYLQGKKDNWWKNDGLVIEQPISDEKIIETMNDITEEMKSYFKEEVNNA